jgi:predicted CopG family antitoxin
VPGWLVLRPSYGGGLGLLPPGRTEPLDSAWAICKATCMSTKTIAVDSRVYERLASAKREGESFSKTIDRLLTQLGAAHTGGEILRQLEDVPALTQDDATAFLRVIDEARRDEDWDRRQ